MKLQVSLSHSVQAALQVGQDVTQALEWRTFTYDHYQYLGEFERMLGMAGHLRFGIGP